MQFDMSVGLSNNVTNATALSSSLESVT